MNGTTVTVGLVGNPNCGKTTLFNALTGARQKTANWPGVTVEKKEGEAFYQGKRLRILDLPGTYSLDAWSLEEKAAASCVRSGEIGVRVNVVDVFALERGLYLTLQLLALGEPLILVLNQMDLAPKRGVRVDEKRLSRMLGGIPVIPVSAKKRTGLRELLLAAVHPERAVPDPAIGRRAAGDPYGYIETVVRTCLTETDSGETASDRADRVLTHRIWGVPIFLLILALVFFLTFAVGNRLRGALEPVLVWSCAGTGRFLARAGTADWLISLVVDGILTGAGGILLFLPNLMILFLALAVLEESGYMTRAAYVMDDVMARAGLSGKAFLPMILGFGCTVPAVLAARVLESERDRRKTIRMVPFLSCSAKLPVYVLFSGMFFGRYAMLAAYSLYLLGVGMAIAAAAASAGVSGGETNPLLIELPEYRMPDARSTFLYVWEKTKDYLTKAGTVIFLASMVLWFVLNYGPAGAVTEVSQSFGARIGRGLVPVLEPAGLGMWQIGVALLGGISAKEVVAASFAVLFGTPDFSSDAGRAALSAALSAAGFGPVNAYALMVFCLLYTPCIAALAAIRKETRSWRLTIQIAGGQLLLAWGMAAAVYQVGRRLFG